MHVLESPGDRRFRPLGYTEAAAGFAHGVRAEIAAADGLDLLSSAVTTSAGRTPLPAGSRRPSCVPSPESRRQRPGCRSSRRASIWNDRASDKRSSMSRALPSPRTFRLPRAACLFGALILADPLVLMPVAAGPAAAAQSTATIVELRSPVFAGGLPDCPSQGPTNPGPSPSPTVTPTAPGHPAARAISAMRPNTLAETGLSSPMALLGAAALFISGVTLLITASRRHRQESAP